MNSNDTTDFGFEKVPTGEKVRRVGEVFRSVAGKYDLMNDLMSLGLHRLWKIHAINLAQVRRGMHCLDLAAGTGDLAAKLARRVGPEGRVVVSDINEAMLNRGRDRLIDDGLVGNVEFVLANAEHLPLPSNSFDRVTIGFGLRNVTDKDQALREMYRVLKPGGMALVLEFSNLYLQRDGGQGILAYLGLLSHYERFLRGEVAVAALAFHGVLITGFLALTVRRLDALRVQA